MEKITPKSIVACLTHVLVHTVSQDHFYSKLLTGAAYSLFSLFIEKLSPFKLFSFCCYLDIIEFMIITLII